MTAVLTQEMRVLTVGRVSLNLDGVHVTVAGHVIPLALREMDVLRLLMENVDRVMCRRQILDACWEPGYPDSNKTLETHLYRLRHKVEADPRHPLHLRTVRGIGYVFERGDLPRPRQQKDAPL